MKAEKAARSLEDMPSPVLTRLLQLLGHIALGQGEYLTDLMNLGLVATEQGHCEQAETYLQEGLALTRRLGHVQLLCSMLYECTNTIPVLQVNVN